MTIIQSIILGIVQGLTEFLPVSSSGHLVIFENILGLTPNGVMEVFLHAGTMLAIIVYYSQRILKLKLDYIKFILIASIPAGALGLLLSDFIETIFSSVLLVGFALLVTGVMNILTDKASQGKQKLSTKNTLIVGAFQALAIIPGISRSGATIFAGTRNGISRKDTAQFSFLLAVPAIFGANLLILKDNPNIFGEQFGLYLAGAISAFATGLFALWILEKLLIAGKFKYFGYYCFAVAIITIIASI